jgi:hypothetical protein
MAPGPSSIGRRTGAICLHVQFMGTLREFGEFNGPHFGCESDTANETLAFVHVAFDDVF